MNTKLAFFLCWFSGLAQAEMWTCYSSPQVPGVVYEVEYRFSDNPWRYSLTKKSKLKSSQMIDIIKSLYGDISRVRAVAHQMFSLELITKGPRAVYDQNTKYLMVH